MFESIENSKFNSIVQKNNYEQYFFVSNELQKFIMLCDDLYNINLILRRDYNLHLI